PRSRSATHRALHSPPTRRSSDLGTIDATGGTDRDRITMYTALYHALLHPNTFQDVDGSYIGYDGELRQVEEGRDFYVNFSGWDRSEEHTSELQSRENLVCRLLLE